MRLFRVHRRAIGVVAAWLLAAQALIAGHMPMPQASVQDALLGEIIICTTRGPVTLKDGAELPLPSQHKPQCPCCMLGCLSSCAGTGTAVAVELHSMAVVVAERAAAVVPAAAEAPAAYLRITTSHPRAPPALIG
jgi:hypothetical protein